MAISWFDCGSCVLEKFIGRFVWCHLSGRLQSGPIALLIINVARVPIRWDKRWSNADAATGAAAPSNRYAASTVVLSCACCPHPFFFFSCLSLDFVLGLSDISDSIPLANDRHRWVMNIKASVIRSWHLMAAIFFLEPAKDVPPSLHPMLLIDELYALDIWAKNRDNWRFKQNAVLGTIRLTLWCYLLTSVEFFAYFG